MTDSRFTRKRLIRKLCYALGAIAAIALICIIAIAIYVFLSLDNLGKSIDKKQEFVFNQDKFCIESRVWGLTDDHMEIKVTDKNNDLKLSFYSSSTYEIYYKIQNDSLIFYVPLNEMDSSSYCNVEKNIKLVDLNTYDDVSNIRANYKKMGLIKYYVFDN